MASGTAAPTAPRRTRPFLLRLLPALAVATLAGGAWAQPPEATCETLLTSLETSFEEARSYELGVGIEQGEREIAYQRQRAERAADGTWTTETLERRGLPRPPGTGGDGPDGGFAELGLVCDGAELETTASGDVVMTLPPVEDGPVTGWNLTFAPLGSRWVPREAIGDFEARIAFVPVRGRFVTTFDAWRFPVD